MVFLAEPHLALGRHEAHALHGGDQGFGIGGAGLADRLDRGDTGAHATGGEEVRRRIQNLRRPLG